MRALMPIIVSCFLAGANGVHTNKLLKEHDAHSNDSALPTPMPEAVKPRLHLKLKLILAGFGLQFGMPLNADFMIESDLSTDLTPFLKDTRVIGRELTKLA
jgi:hypothetical protein